MLNNHQLELVKSQLAQLATQENFETVFNTAFGTKIDPSKIFKLRQQWLKRDFSLIPQIETLSPEEIRNTNPNEITNLLIEKIGNKLDLVASLFSLDRGSANAAHLPQQQEDRGLNLGSPGDKQVKNSLLATRQQVSQPQTEQDRQVTRIEDRSLEVKTPNLVGTTSNSTLSGTPSSSSVPLLSLNQNNSDAEAAKLIGLERFYTNTLFTGINGSGYSVVVLDTGIDLDHPFFGGDANHDGISDRIVFSTDFSGNNDNDASDTNGHGTLVSGIVASTARGVNIIHLKVFSDGAKPSGRDSDYEEALQWVINNRQRFNIVAVNMSIHHHNFFNTVTTDPQLGNEFQTLVNNGVIPVVITGNDYKGNAGVSELAADPNTLSVGSVDDTSDLISSFSQRGALLDIFAPGSSITSANNGGGSRDDSGTSLAAPYIAGIVALAQQLAVRALARRLSFQEFRDLLQTTGVIVKDGNTDYQRVDVNALGQGILTGQTGILPTSGNDTLVGNAQNNCIAGFRGADIISGGGGDDTLYGGADNDRLYGGADNDQLYGGTGTDTLSGGADDDYLYGGADDDSLYGEAGNDSLDGGTGNDSLDGGAGNDSLYGREGNDLLSGGAGTDDLYGGDGNDSLYGRDDTDYLFGENGNDTLHGDAGNDYLSGGAGDDNLYGDAGNDKLYGDAGNDYLSGGDGNDTLDGGTGKDKMDGGSGIDTVDYRFWSTGGTYNLAIGSAAFFGLYIEQILNFENILTGAGNDIVTGSSADNRIVTGAGNDTIIGGLGTDTMIGGAGKDFYYVDNINDVVIESINEGIDSVISSVSFTLSDNVENLTIVGTGNSHGVGNGLNNNLTGGNGNDQLDGGAGNDILNGGAGDDTLYGEAGNDTLYGGAGNDTLLVFGTGNDILDGGEGNDFYAIDHRDLGVHTIVESSTSGSRDAIVASNTTSAAITIDISKTTTQTIATGVQLVIPVVSIEFVYGGNGNNTIIGNYLDNYLVGKAGNDYLDGAAGNDFLVGDAGDDTINGGAGIDDLYGGAGDDTINGGVGSDDLHGEAGNDRFLFNGGVAISGANTVASLLGQDRIHGFAKNQDKIYLSSSTFTAITTLGALSTDNFAMIATDSDADTTTSSAAILYSSTGNLFYNQNGALAGLGTNGGSFATVTGNPVLAATDFSIVA